MPKFHETLYGRRFFDSQLPQLIKALERIADNLTTKVIAFDTETTGLGYKALRNILNTDTEEDDDKRGPSKPPDLPTCTARVATDHKDSGEPAGWNFRLSYTAQLPARTRTHLASKAIDAMAGRKLDPQALCYIGSLVTAEIRRLYEVNDLYWDCIKGQWVWADDEDILEAAELLDALEGDLMPYERAQIEDRLAGIERRRKNRITETEKGAL